MKLARVIGTVVATVKHSTFDGQKILMIQPLDGELRPDGKPIAAIDSVQAGPGDLVHWIMARESCYVLPDWFAPVDASITGIVDIVNVEDVGIKDREFIFGKVESDDTGKS